MPRTQTTCPRCRQPVLVDVEQLFDQNTNPQAKQQLLSGQFNTIRCQNCGYEGTMSTPIVYHDPDKELLMTYFPAELGLPVNEQERLIGPLINKVVNALPNEKRKAYLLRPQTMLTYQVLVERILEGEGITREMLDDQQKRINLLQRLLTTTTADVRVEIMKQEAALIDNGFFNILTRLIEGTLQQGDQQGARQLAALQQELLTHTEFGRQLAEQAGEAEAAMRSLQEASQQGLTRDKLLDLIIEAPNETRLNTLIEMAHTGLDYEFFQLLTARVEAAKDDEEKKKLAALREKLLVRTREIELEMQQQMDEMRGFLDELLKQPDIERATQANLRAVNDLFIEVLRGELQAARQSGDNERLSKLQKVVNVIQAASTPPPEVALIEELATAEDETARQAVMERNADKITPEFIELIRSVSAQAEQQGQDPETVKQFQEIYRSALRFSMAQNMKKGQ